MRSRHLFILFAVLLAFSCKKSNERSCWKSFGEYTEIEIPLDTIDSFSLLKNIKYTIIEDSLKKVVIKGGENVVGLIELDVQGTEATIRNNNKCNFLRDNENIIEVEIHYPYYKKIYCEPSDSVVFENTITSDSLFFEIRNGGGSSVLDVDVNFLRINVSFGTGDYELSGTADHAEVKVQNNGFAECRQFNAGYIFVHSFSTSDLYLNLEASTVLLDMQGTGDVYYTGNYSDITDLSGGSGQFIKL